MANVAADLIARVTADTGGAVRGLQSFAGSILDVGAKAGLAVIGVGALFQAGSSMVSGLLTGAAEMERYETQLTTLMGSADLAKNRLEELARFGASTPFELPELVRAEKVLQGFGLTGQKAFQMTGLEYDKFFTRVGDIAAGVGKPFEEVALNFAKLSSGATGEAISRFQELGIATREQMAALGVEFDKAGSLMSPIPVAMQAIMQLTESKFSGGMDKLSGTFEGRMSSLNDAWTQLVAGFATPLLTVAGPAVAKLSELLGNEAITGGAKRAGEAIAEGLGQIGPAFDRIRPAFDVFAPMLQIASDNAETFRQALAGEWVNAEGIYPLTAAIGVFATSLRDDVIPSALEFSAWMRDDVLPAAQPLIAAFEQFATSGVSQLQGALGGVLTVAGPLAATLIDGIRPAMETVGGYIGGTLVPAVQSVASFLGPFLQPMLENVGTAFANLGQQMGPMMDTLGPLGQELGNLGVALTPVLAILGGVLIAGLVTSWEAISGLLMGIPTVVRGVVQGVTLAIGGWADIIGGVVGIVAGIIAGDWTGAWNSAGRVVEGAFNIIHGIVTAATGLILGVITGFVSAGLNILGQLVPGARDEITRFKNAFVEGIQSIDLGAMIKQQLDNMIGSIARGIPGVQAVLGQLRALFPSSPAETGPWRNLPDWESAFNTLPEALTGAQTLALDGLSELKRLFDGSQGVMGTLRAEIAGNVAGVAVAGAVAMGAGATPGGPLAQAAKKVPETLTVNVPVEISGNNFGIGPNGALTPEDQQRIAELIAPIVAALILEQMAGDDGEGE